MTTKITAGYFGKLPQYNDFIKFNAGGPEILKIDEWIQQGIRSARLKQRSNWKTVYRNAPPFYFIYSHTDTSNIIAGIIKPGHDKNKREYPFIIFFTFPAADVHVHLLPLILASPFNEISTNGKNYFTLLKDELASFTMYVSDSEYYELFNEHLMTPQKQFWAGILADESLVQNFKNNLIHLNLLDSSAGKFSISSSEESLPYNLGILILLLSSSVDISRTPALFWSSQDLQHTVYFSFRHSDLKYDDLIDPGQQIPDLNNPAKNTKMDHTAEDILSNEGTVDEFIIKIKHLKEQNHA